MPSTHCARCGEQVVKAHLQGGGDEVILDPRPRVFLRIHRADRQVEAWLSSEAMVEHAGVCVDRVPPAHTTTEFRSGMVHATQVAPPPADPQGDVITTPATSGLGTFLTAFLAIAAALLIPTALTYHCNPTPLD